MYAVGAPPDLAFVDGSFEEFVQQQVAEVRVLVERLFDVAQETAVT